MKKREKTLAIAVGVLAAFYVGSWLFHNALEGPLEAKRKTITRLNRDIEKKEAKLVRARRTAKELAEWNAQSLPSDLGQAPGLYRTWLDLVCKRVGFDDLNVGSSDPVGRKGSYAKLVFTVRGYVTLAQLVEFLWEFYSTDHLHKIQKLDITPTKDNQLDLSIAIEALALPEADRKENLTPRKSNRLASSTVDDYLQPIVNRDLFRIVGSGSDPTDLTYLTAVIENDGQLEAWFTLRGKDRMLKLRVGETLDIGQFRGAVAEIVEGDVVIESEGERWLLTIGENLANAASLPPEY